VYVLTA
jgi:hypothetical protein